jgi:hypothetical protein
MEREVMKLVVLRKRPQCTEKRKARFIQGGWPEAGAEPANDGSGELRMFLPKNRIVCQVQNSLDLGRCSVMKRAIY